MGKAPDPEVEAAIAAVAEGPLDDGRRRVLADLLLERGDPRGEFLMLQFLIAANQGSGPMRQQADELWRRHRHEWMAGVETSFEDLALENGFPVSATIRLGLTAAQIDRLLASPMTATLRHLDARAGAEQVLVRAACDVRFHALERLTVRSEPAFLAIAEGGVPNRLRRLHLAFVPTWPRLQQLVSSSAFAELRALSLKLATWQPPSRRFLRRSEDEATASPLAPEKVLELLSQRASLAEVELTSASFGDAPLFEAVARAWPRLPFTRVSSPGTFELARGPDGTSLTLQNLPFTLLRELRRSVPKDVTRARLMRRRSTFNSADEREAVLAAWTGLDVTVS